MVVDRHGNDLLGIFLADHIIVQLCLDLMGCRNGLHIEGLLRSLLFLFLLDLLPLGNLLIHQIRQINHADIRHIGGHILEILRPDIHHHITVGEGTVVHGVKGFLHAVGADTDILRKMNHLSRLALRPATDKAHILMSILILCAFGLFSIVNNDFFIV